MAIGKSALRLLPAFLIAFTVTADITTHLYSDRPCNGSPSTSITTNSPPPPYTEYVKVSWSITGGVYCGNGAGLGNDLFSAAIYDHNDNVLFDDVQVAPPTFMGNDCDPPAEPLRLTPPAVYIPASSVAQGMRYWASGCSEHPDDANATADLIVEYQYYQCVVDAETNPVVTVKKTGQGTAKVHVAFTFPEEAHANGRTLTLKTLPWKDGKGRVQSETVVGGWDFDLDEISPDGLYTVDVNLPSNSRQVQLVAEASYERPDQECVALQMGYAAIDCSKLQRYDW